MPKAPPSETYDPTDGMSQWQRFAAGMGQGMVSLSRFFAKTVGLMSQKEYDEKRLESERLDAPLLNTPAGQWGSVAGQTTIGVGVAAVGAVIAPEVAATTTTTGTTTAARVLLNTFGKMEVGGGIGVAFLGDTLARVEDATKGSGPLAAAAIVVDANQQGGPGTLSCDDPRLNPPVDTSILSVSVPATLAFAAVSSIPAVRATRLLAMPANELLMTGQAATQMGAWMTGSDLASREVSTMKCKQYAGQLTEDLNRVQAQTKVQEQAAAPPTASPSASTSKTPSPG